MQIDDEAVEVSENYQVVLSNPGSSTGANIALGTSAVTTAILDDNERRLTISNVTHTEGTSLNGFTPYEFTVSLSDVTTTSSVTVDVSTFDGSATTAGEDYQRSPISRDLCAGRDGADGDGAGAAGRSGGVRRVFPGAAEQRRPMRRSKQPHLRRRRRLSARSPTTTCTPSGSARG